MKIILRTGNSMDFHIEFANLSAEKKTPKGLIIT